MKIRCALPITIALAMSVALAAAARAQDSLIRFHLERSVAVSTARCLTQGSASVTVKSLGEVEVMSIAASGLPPNAGFDVFVIQLPNAPFGMAWYQGDMQSDSQGRAQATFIGRFNQETFMVAPGVGPAPVVHPSSDSDVNPVTDPVHMFHVGIWFNSPADAAKAGCPMTMTPFNGEHNAGIQALSSNSFSRTNGPLRGLKP